MKAEEILTALKASSTDKIWATELALRGGKRRIDFWSLEPAASKGWRATSYEIKVSKQDYRNDGIEKQAEALRYSDRFFYVTPPNLIYKKEVPDWAGLMEWDGKAFAVKKRAPKLTKQEPDWEFIVGLLRSSKEVRRDSDFTTSQIRYLQWRVNQLETLDKLRDQRNWERWQRQHQQEPTKQIKTYQFEKDMRKADEGKDYPEGN